MPITKQTIAIIGAGGDLGSALAKGIISGNYRLLLFGTKLDSLAETIYTEHPKAEVKIMDCAYECSWEADIIILDIPKANEKEIAEKIHNVAIQKIVMHIDGNVDEDSPIVSDRLQSRLPYSKIVTVLKQGLMPRVIISGDDQDALHNISELLKTAGFKVSQTLKPTRTGTY
ncbi:NAD(P)-binding domain-containing protein [Rhodohalobacter halophilus]|uniref:NAD(P)-binding domain-containing protein n=1 Tax=Rhodohalobacter halophilus TaxID=1812810 RepID=UPI00083FC2DB|nr:NAD(P)-binding domain-containing protein [Rhodohalobacter halophilus]